VPGELDDGLRPARARLLSAEIPAPTAAQLAQPVVITAHGFSATTFETAPVASRLRSRGALVSELLLGGHGTSLKDFSQSTWETWQAPLVQEYQALRVKGYQSIGFLTTSTAGALLLEGLGRGLFQPVPQRLAMVAPLVDFANENRQLGYAGLLGWFGVAGQAVERPGVTKGNWYHYRPLPQLTQLLDLTEVTKGRLREGITLEADAKVLVVQALGDTTVDPRSAEHVRKGLRGAAVEVLYLDSAWHIPIWPDGVSPIQTPQEFENRDTALTAIGRHLVP
jgi:carboxylesterase